MAHMIYRLEMIGTWNLSSQKPSSYWLVSRDPIGHLINTWLLVSADTQKKHRGSSSQLSGAKQGRNNQPDIPSGKRLHSYGKIVNHPFSWVNQL